FLHLPHRPMRCRIGIQSDLCRFAGVLHGAAEKAFGRVHVALAAEEEIDGVPRLVHRSVQVDPPSSNLYICLVHPPRSTYRTSVALPAFLKFRQVMLDPTQNGGVSKRDTSIRHHDHQVSEAQFETGIPANTEDDDLSVEMPPGEQCLDRKEPTHPAMILYRRAVCTRAEIGSTVDESGSRKRWYSLTSPVGWET